MPEKYRWDKEIEFGSIKGIRDFIYQKEIDFELFEPAYPIIRYTEAVKTALNSPSIITDATVQNANFDEAAQVLVDLIEAQGTGRFDGQMATKAAAYLARELKPDQFTDVLETAGRFLRSKSAEQTSIVIRDGDGGRGFLDGEEGRSGEYRTAYLQALQSGLDAGLATLNTYTLPSEPPWSYWPDGAPVHPALPGSTEDFKTIAMLSVLHIYGLTAPSRTEAERLIEDGGRHISRRDAMMAGRARRDSRLSSFEPSFPLPIKTTMRTGVRR